LRTEGRIKYDKRPEKLIEDIENEIEWLVKCDGNFWPFMGRFDGNMDITKEVIMMVIKHLELTSSLIKTICVTGVIEKLCRKLFFVN